MIAELPYAELQCMLDDPPGYRNYWSAEYLDAFPDEAVDLFCARAPDMIVPSPSQHVLFPQGGAVAARPGGLSDPVAAGAPGASIRSACGRTRPTTSAQGGGRATSGPTCSPWATGAVYLNFIGDEGQDRVVAGFGRENYRRLAAVKADYDPDNVFRLNHNIEPR